MPADSTPQGFAPGARERLPLPPADAMTPGQRAAAEALVAGPRKGVFGPFLPLMRSPALLERVGKVGEYLRFESVLDARVRELATCAVARHVHNQFEWQMHVPLALKAGVAQATLDAVGAGARPKSLAPDEEAALDFTRELLATNGVCDATYATAREAFGEQGVVELATLVGYFAMVNWVMNVARTAGPAGSQVPPLAPYPA